MRLQAGSAYATKHRPNRKCKQNQSQSRRESVKDIGYGNRRHYKDQRDPHQGAAAADTGKRHGMMKLPASVRMPNAA